jgi:RNA-dependent RNA polymerase
MRNIPYAVDEIQLNRQLQPTLHGPIFQPVFQSGAPFDYRIQLFKGKRRGQGHSGCGIITVPTEAIGQQLITLGSITVHGRGVIFTQSDKSARPEHIEMIQRPYQDPLRREQENQRRAELATKIGISWVQLCWAGFNQVSIEWQSHGNWLVLFDDDSRAIVLQRESWRIIIRNITISNIEEDGALCYLSLDVPPVVGVEPEPQSQENGNHPLADNLDIPTAEMASLSLDSPPLRDRRSALEEEQEAIIPFVNVLRFRFADLSSGMEEFKSKVKLIDRRVHAYRGPEPTHRGWFTSTSLGELQDWCQRQEYGIAFRVHAILCKRLIAPVMLLDLVPAFEQVIHDLDPDDVVDILKRFGTLLDKPEECMADWKPSEFLEHCIEKRATSVSRRGVSQEEASRLFECYHVIITPTSHLLSGPIPDTSNRVLRWYPDHQHQFLRVEFTEEDGNNLRLDREVDSAKFVQQRFGDVLKNGIRVAGRRFEFLAYSQSALRDHAVWFMSPFSTLHALP